LSLSVSELWEIALPALLSGIIVEHAKCMH